MSNARHIADVAPTLGRKNLLINGNFEVWQRGTSFTTPSSIYTADRWKGIASGSGGNIARNPALYGLSLNVGTAGGTGYLWQPIELLSAGVAMPFEVGDTVTISGEVYTTDTANTVQIELQYRDDSAGGANNVTDMDYVSIGTLTSGWNTFSITHTLTQTLNSTNTCLCLIIKQVQNSSVGCTYKKLQLEFGPKATDFDKRLMAEERLLCMRYYEKGSSYNTQFWCGNVTSGVSYYRRHQFRVPKRATPTLSLTAEAAYGFPASVGTTWVDANGWQEMRNASSTLSGGNWGTVWAADAEL